MPFSGAAASWQGTACIYITKLFYPFKYVGHMQTVCWERLVQTPRWFTGTLHRVQCCLTPAQTMPGVLLTLQTHRKSSPSDWKCSSVPSTRYEWLLRQTLDLLILVCNAVRTFNSIDISSFWTISFYSICNYFWIPRVLKSSRVQLGLNLFSSAKYQPAISPSWIPFISSFCKATFT